MGTSPIEDINAAIARENPFQTLAIVREQDIWEETFPDLEALNAHASATVFQAIEQVRQDTSGLKKITSMVITATKGVGKSHIISRIRRRCQREGSAWFIYAGVEKYALNAINAEFQQTLAQSLDRVGTEGVTQWQELATFLANQVWKAGNPNAQCFTGRQLFDKVNNPPKPEAQIHQWVELITDKFNCIPRSKRIDPDLVRAIFLTLSAPHSIYAVKWLSGRDLSENKAKTLGLPTSNLEVDKTDSKAFDNVCEILSLLSEHKPLAICFDELDLPDTRLSQTGLGRPHLIARTIKTLMDSVSLSNTSNGIVILTVMMPDTWTLKVRNMPGGTVDRISATGNPINLNFPNADEIVALAEMWLSKFYKDNNLEVFPAFYPFEESELRQLSGGNSIRAIIKWCADNFKPTNTIVENESRIEKAYAKELASLAKNKAGLLEDKTKIASALWLCFCTLKAKRINNFEIEKLDGKIEPVNDNKYGNGNYIDFKIIGRENGKLVKVGVSVFQKIYWSSEKAAMNRLNAYKKFGINRGCLVRSRFLSGNDAQEALNLLLSPQKGGLWVNFSYEDLKPILAIWSVYKGQLDYEVSDQEVVNFINDKKIAIENPIIQGILSEPTGTIPEGLTDD